MLTIPRTPAKIDQLGIRGIRSFGPEGAESVKFNTPLTLIVGENGSGKTTIIECLKYATTGEQPPNSKGGAFIHDPKLRNEKEVKGQVRLQFFSTIGQKLVVARSLQITQGKVKTTVKTLDGTLQIMNGNEKISISKKNAELDEMIPEKMGVPAAILESVIFCHQDDSLWPLSEPSVLKKKFDELFEAIKYTRAIDNLKVLRKKHGEQLRIFKALEESSKQDKEKGERYEKAIKVLEADIKDLERDYDVNMEKMTKVGEKEAAKRKEANSFLGIMNDLENKKDRFEGQKQFADDLLQSIERMDESDSSLESALAQYAQKVEQMKKDLGERSKQWSQLQSELSETRATLQERHGERGKHASDKEHHERQLSTRLDMIREAAQHHGIRGYDGDLTDAQVKSFENRTQKLLEERKRELTELNQALQKLKNDHDREISNLTASKEYLTKDRVTAQERMKTMGDNLTRLQRDADKLDVDEGARAVLETNFKQAEDRLRNAQEALKKADLDTQIHKEADQLQQLESEAARLTNELVQCTHLASERAQLDLRKKEAEDQKVYLKSVTGTWGEKLSKLTGGPLNPETIESEYQKVLGEHAADVSTKKKLVDQAHQEIKQLDFKLSSIREEEKKLLKESQRSDKAVSDALEKCKDEGEAAQPIDSYTEMLSTVQNDLAGVEQDIVAYSRFYDFFQLADKKLKQESKCHMCDRAFGDCDGFAKSKLAKKLAKSLNPEEHADNLADAEKLKKEVGFLKSVQTQYDTYQRIKAQLPVLRKSMEDIEAEKQGLVEKQEELDAHLRDAEERRMDVEALGKAVRSITDAVAQIAESEKQIERLESQQSSVGVVRSAQEIQDAQVSCSESTRALNIKINKMKADFQRRKDEISRLELERSELQGKQSEFEQKLQRKIDFLGQIESLKKDRADLDQKKKDAAIKLEELEHKLAKAKSLREEEVNRQWEKVQKAEEQRTYIANTVDKLQTIGSEIQDYVDRGGPAQNVANERAIKSLQGIVDRTESEISALTVEINKLRQEVESSDRKKKNIQDNLAYNRTQKVLDKLQQEIDELEKRNAQEDWSRLDAECIKHKQDYDRLSGKSHVLMGTIETKRAELDSRLAEYEQDFSDARTKYREAHIKVETTKAAIEDMASYGAALEKAIMSYHSLKMEEVNRIAGDLWRTTYQGTDIDTIMIRSEVETSGTASTTRRTYNYRLCMVKQDAEMDMRGRCSAGQKVLASIIIRLALAESFGVSCGLIALDEPTTNLDEANIRSLAVSLHKIITDRHKAQANFQLIVITHDEAFLRAMQCSDFCDTFYRVKRDERQMSRIWRENISSLMD